MASIALRRLYLLGVAAGAIAAAAAEPASAQVANITPATGNVLNLLSPFLGLNSTAIGQQTLQVNLGQAIAINQNTASVAVLNGYPSSTTALAAVAISDENSMGAASNTVYGLSTSQTFGPAANLAGGLPTQNTTSYNTYTNGAQPIGGFGSVLGAAYVAGVSPSALSLPKTVALLTTAFNFTGNSLATGDSQVAKFYFANGTWNGTATAVATAGYTLPTDTLSTPSTTLPNTTNSVYDIAYGVTNTQSGQNAYGDSHPYQTWSTVPGATYTLYDPTVKTTTTVPGAVNPDKPSSNPSFPSSHMAYAMTDSVLLGMMVPQLYQSMLMRASQMGDSRIVVGVHYPLDIIASRAYISYDLVQYLSNPAYINNAATTGTAVNLPGLLASAQSELQASLTAAAATASCGTSLATCATSAANVNPYAPSATNDAIYTARLTYGLPTTAGGAKELTDTNGSDASILLVTVYGGDSAAAQNLKSQLGISAGMNGNLSTATIKQVIANTETDPITAFVGTSLSYWSRINLYDAIGYFQNVIGTITLAATDQLATNVTVAATGVLGGNGAITGGLVVQSGGALAAQGNGAAVVAPLTVNGGAALQAGSRVDLGGLYLPGRSYTLLSATGTITVDPSVVVDIPQASTLMTAMSGSLSVTGDPALVLTMRSNFAATAMTANQRNVAAGIDAGANAGTYGASGAALLTTLIQNNTAATAPAAFDSLSGEGITGQQQVAFGAADLFASTVIGAALDGVAGDATGAGARRRVWAAGFGQSSSLNGDSGTGSAGLSGHNAGFATGLDYRLDNGLLLGIVGGYSNSGFSVNGRATSGSIDGGHFGVYGIQRWGGAYLAGTLDDSEFSTTTNRTVAGIASERGSFSANEFLGRFEGGYKFALPQLNVTPLGGFQAAWLANSGFSESGSAGGIANLNVNSRTIDSDKLYLGVQLDTSRTLGAGMALTPYARVAWEHEFSTTRSLSASLQSLPGSGFTVDGAPAAANLARVIAGAKVDVSQSVALFAAFDGSFSGNGNSYGGKGGVRVVW